MARWGNRYARNRARQAYNNWWRSTGKKTQSSGSPEDNDGCVTVLFWLFIGGPIMLFLIMLFK